MKPEQNRLCSQLDELYFIKTSPQRKSVNVRSAYLNKALAQNESCLFLKWRTNTVKHCVWGPRGSVKYMSVCLNLLFLTLQEECLAEVVSRLLSAFHAKWNKWVHFSNIQTALLTILQILFVLFWWHIFKGQKFLSSYTLQLRQHFLPFYEMLNNIAKEVDVEKCIPPFIFYFTTVITW